MTKSPQMVRDFKNGRAAKELEDALTDMIGEWERSDELPSELAGRILDYLKASALQASDEQVAATAIT